MGASRATQGPTGRQRGGARPARTRGPSPSGPDVGARDPASVLELQRLAGNRAVTSLLSSDMRVTAADDAFEHAAERAEHGRVPQGEHGGRGPGGQRTSPLAHDAGARLAPGIEQRLGHGPGGLAHVRVHTGADADALTTTMGAEALTHGTDIFVSSRHALGSGAGQDLLAHEATHATGAAAASGQVHLKRVPKHLDFLRIKKKDTHIAREIGQRLFAKLGAKGLAEKIATNAQGEEYDTYGHWWIEAGKLTDPASAGSWQSKESYGWWPENGVNLAQTLKIERVEGKLNQGATLDPHHGERAETEYHPVLSVEDTADYATVRDQVMADVRSFATSFKGSWNWRLGWGKNCHTFIDRLKKRLGLHHTRAKSWLSGEGAGAIPAPPVDFAKVKGAWSDLAGMGFGALEIGKHVLRRGCTLAQLAGLSDEQKTELAAIINQGCEGWNLMKAAEFNDMVRSAYATDADGTDVEIFSDRHLQAPTGTASSPGATGTDSPRREVFDEDTFLAGLAAREVKTLTADLQAGPKVVPGGTEIMVLEVNELEGKVRIELPISAGAGRYWVTARQLATALGT
jgi:hypothetical protein